MAKHRYASSSPFLGLLRGQRGLRHRIKFAWDSPFPRPREVMLDGKKYIEIGTQSDGCLIFYNKRTRKIYDKPFVEIFEEKE